MGKNNLSEKAICLIHKCTPYEYGFINVNEIAQRLDISVPHLSKCFKCYMGIGLKKFINREKIIRARFLLKQNNNLRVKDVATILDFGSTDYFIKIFKKESGLTPGKFREIDLGFYGLKDRRIKNNIPKKERRNTNFLFNQYIND